jgi:hypothetical protein
LIADRPLDFHQESGSTELAGVEVVGGTQIERESRRLFESGVVKRRPGIGEARLGPDVRFRAGPKGGRDGPDETELTNLNGRIPLGSKFTPFVPERVYTYNSFQNQASLR